VTSGSYRPLQPSVKQCKTCAAPIFWVEIVSTGKRMPVNAQPSPRGTVVLRDGRDAEVLGPIAASEYKGMKYESHFATCPQAKSWRRRRGDPEPPGATR
jgi:hypothetical protein